MMMNEEAMTNEEAIKLLSQVRDAILASNSWLPSTDNPIKECFGMAIEALKAQDAAGDTISRQAALDALRTCYDTETVTMSNGDEYINYEDAVGEIEQLPPAQPEVLACGEGELIAQPEQKGYWRHYEGYLTCSECGTEYYADIMEYCGDDVPKFCPNCGAKMEENDDDDD